MEATGASLWAFADVMSEMTPPPECGCHLMFNNLSKIPLPAFGTAAGQAATAHVWSMAGPSVALPAEDGSVRVFLQRDSDYPAGVTAANFAAAIVKGGQGTLGGRGRSSRRLSNADMGAAKRRLSWGRRR